jgi:hypothetical protein
VPIFLYSLQADIRILVYINSFMATLNTRPVEEQPVDRKESGRVNAPFQTSIGNRHASTLSVISGPPSGLGAGNHMDFVSKRGDHDSAETSTVVIPELNIGKDLE